LNCYEMDCLRQVPRYLKAIRIRVERAYTSPQKDQVKAQQLAVHQDRLNGSLEELENGGSFQRAEKVQEYRWMIEEFKISLFAQELGTRYPISAKRLEKKWEEIQNS